MMKRAAFLVLWIVIRFATPAVAQTDSLAKLDWFSNARLGIFIHWGIYAVDGVGESWSFHNKHIPHDVYMQQIERFNAENYKPEEWVRVIKSSGARYAVITSKHHDGVALWNTKANALSIPAASPAKRDVLTPFVTELRKAGLKTGLYFSLIDWTHPDYPGFLRDSSRYKVADDTLRWNRYMQFCNRQIDELLVQYNPDLWWFDGDWEHSAEEWNAPGIRHRILARNPSAIINARLQGYGDYATPEQHTPIIPPESRAWELCMTMNDSWGYQGSDTNYKTPFEIISIFADVISAGGNLLLDIGPKADGTIPEEQVHILKELGRWTSKHSEAIFDTRRGLPYGHFYGPTTLSADSTVLYLFLSQGASDKLVIKGLRNKIRKISVLGTPQTLGHKIVGKISWSSVPGLVYIDVPENVHDSYITVIRVELDGPVSLYRGKGGFH
ncbi:MAG TPA: alpha-L-fucosidase [Bacteroidales bacterium]|nr:alpha-L-fucosidase [Bacteroidales bacterium]